MVVYPSLAMSTLGLNYKHARLIKTRKIKIKISKQISQGGGWPLVYEILFISFDYYIPPLTPPQTPPPPSPTPTSLPLQLLLY